MSELPFQRTSELIRGVIELLWSKPEGLPAKEVLAHLPELIKLTPAELDLLPAIEIPRYEQLVRHGTYPLVKAGWLVKTAKGRWLLTEEGRNACKRFSSPTDFYQEALRISEQGQQDIMDILLFLETTQEKSWDYIEKYIREKSLVEIRSLVEMLFEALQYHLIWMAPPGKNRGVIDLIASVDPLGAKPCRIIVQVKHKGQPVTLEGLKSFHGVLGTNDYGLLLSTGGFTKDAREALNQVAYQKINAMDLEKFYDLWIKYYDKLSADAHKLLPFKTIFILSPHD